MGIYYICEYSEYCAACKRVKASHRVLGHYDWLTSAYLALPRRLKGLYSLN